MINFEEELKKFYPSLELDEAQEAIAGQDLSDVTDILVAMLAEGNESGSGQRSRRVRR